MLSEEYGGRVELAKAYYKALTTSVKKHFKGNGVIASMEHCNDFFLLGTEAITLGPVGDDFWCTDPSGDPNASRAISGGPIYVRDCVGKHNFKLLKRRIDYVNDMSLDLLSRLSATCPQLHFARSESNSSFESESAVAARQLDGADAADDKYESDEYGAFKEDFRYGVNFQPSPPLRSSQSLTSSLPLKGRDFGENSDSATRGCGTSYGAAIISMINRGMKEHSNHLLRAAHGISAQIAQLEARTRQLEGLIGNLKDSTEFYHRRAERRLGEVEDMMIEVQGSIQDLKDKQKIAEIQLQLAKLQQIKADSQSKHQNRNVQNKLVQQQVSYVHQQDHQPHPSPAVCQQKLCDIASHDPRNSVQTSLQTPATTATQTVGQNQPRFIQPFQTYYQFPVPAPAPDMLPTQSSMTQYQPYMHSSFSESSQLARPQTPHGVRHSSVYQVNQNPQGPIYMPSEDSRFPVSAPQQFNVVSTQYIKNQRPGSTVTTPGHSNQPRSYDSNDQYREGSPLQYWGSTRKTSALPTHSVTPKVLPRALPMAVDVNEASSSGGTERSVSIEDIVENAVAMGFRRDTVKATVKKLTENEQRVDLNLVLDSLISSAEIQR
ncbi:vegetative cell wall protein gp1 isoform X2 [Senna tora]|uniref:Vegetative cell wall protein gp1 isoform X2 n=1 Tax=Senna tora TaxID=362788 RepID=A0A834X4Y6_9FABA|nr:vegetative cell wall protein gp1 isoform X2 [Senna tora]